MNPSRNDIELALSYLEKSLDDRETAAVEARLKTEPAFADLLMLLSRNEAVIAEWSATVRPGIAAEEAVFPQAKETVRHRFANGKVAVAAAFAVILAVGAYFLFKVPESKPTSQLVAWAANLEEVSGDAFLIGDDGESTPIVTGQKLSPGQQIRTGEGGTAVVRLPDSTRVELGTETVLKMPMGSPMGEGQKSLMLESGSVRAEVPKRPKGDPVTLTTPHAVIRADGTRFTSTAAGGATRVESETGSVNMTVSGNGQTMTVNEGRYVVTPPKKEKVAPQQVPVRATVPKEVLPFPSGPVATALVSTSGESLAIATWDASLVIRNMQTGMLVGPIRDMSKRIRSMAFSPNGQLLATYSDDRFLKIRNGISGEEILTLKKLRTDVEALVFSPDGKTLFGTQGPIGGRAEIKMWDTTTGLEIGTLSGHAKAIFALAFDKTGRRLFSGSRDGTLKVWNLEKRELIETLEVSRDGVQALAMNPTGDTLAVGGRDGIIQLFEIETMLVRTVIDAHPREVTSLAYSPDGRYLASAGSEPVIRLWDVRTSAVARQFQAHRSKVGQVSFTPDGRMLVSCGWDNTVKMWNVD